MAPELWPGNIQVWQLWLSVRTQWRGAGFGLIGLDYPAALQVAGILGIEVDEGMLAKLQALERVELDRQAERNKEQ